MRDVVEFLFGMAIAVLGTSFLLGVLVGMVFASIGRTSQRRGVVLPVKGGVPRTAPSTTAKAAMN